VNKEKVMQVVKDYAKAVTEQMLVNSIVLYGSYARGENRNTSDIDVAIIVPREAISKDILKDMAKLFRIAYDFSDDIEPVLIIDGEDKSGFQEHILSYGEVIYSKAS